jgi:hypothetical protein
MQSLHADWQTVDILLSELRVPDFDAVPHDCLVILKVRMCARLYALSKVEIELIYPPLHDVDAREAGRNMHRRMMTSLQGVLRGIAGEEQTGDEALEALAIDVRRLEQFEHENVYPLCVDSASIGERMARRRKELLKTFNDS